jgi:molecular chaperone GrpE
MVRIPITDKETIEEAVEGAVAANGGEMTEEGLEDEPSSHANFGTGAGIRNEDAVSTEGESAAEGGSSTESETDSAAQLESELAQSKAALLQLAADFENFRRQAQRRETEARERAVRTLVEDLLPVLDNFERAIAAAQNATDVKSLRMGVEFILQQLQGALRSHGVEPIEATGKPFDPQQHEAIDQVSSWDHAAGTVVEETQRGYTHKGHVLRPASVKVAQ